MITNHYGIYVNSDVPVTGVYSVHDIDWSWISDEICLDCIEAEKNDPDCEYDIECDSSHTRLIGDWKQNDDGLWEPDKEGEYAAIERETVVQVVWSKYLTSGHLCSPCYPGQVDVHVDEMDEPGPYKAYAMPEELIWRNK